MGNPWSPFPGGVYGFARHPRRPLRRRLRLRPRASRPRARPPPTALSAARLVSESLYTLVFSRAAARRGGTEGALIAVRAGGDAAGAGAAPLHGGPRAPAPLLLHQRVPRQSPARPARPRPCPRPRPAPPRARAPRVQSLMPGAIFGRRCRRWPTRCTRATAQRSPRPTPRARRGAGARRGAARRGRRRARRWGFRATRSCSATSTNSSRCARRNPLRAARRAAGWGGWMRRGGPTG